MHQSKIGCKISVMRVIVAYNLFIQILESSVVLVTTHHILLVLV